MFEDLKEDRKSELKGTLPFSESFLKGWYVGAVVGGVLLGILTLAAGRPGNPLMFGLIFIAGGGCVGALVSNFRRR